MKTLRLVKMLAFVALLGTSSAAYGQDIVVTMSGDRLVGEIQKVEKDVLTLSTPYSDSDFKIEWGDVVSIQSTRQFVVETFEGRLITGSLTPGSAEQGRPGRRHECAARPGRDDVRGE